MTARALGVALVVVLVATVAIRAAALVELFSGRTLTVELSRWEDRELADDVERAIGLWLAQTPRPDLRISYVDRPELAGRARLTLDGRTAVVRQGPSRAQLRPPLEELRRRLDRPRRVFLVATDRPVDQRFAAVARELLTELGLGRIVVIPAPRLSDEGSPTVPSGPGDWVVVATEAGREHLASLLRARGRKIFMLPPYAAALRRPHPDLWFIAPWNPGREYLARTPVSSCAAARRLGELGDFWPVTGVPLWTLAALAEVAGDGLTAELPLTLVGSSESGQGPAREDRAGEPLPACP